MHESAREGLSGILPINNQGGESYMKLLRRRQTKGAASRTAPFHF